MRSKLGNKAFGIQKSSPNYLMRARRTITSLPSARTLVSVAFSIFQSWTRVFAEESFV